MKTFRLAAVAITCAPLAVLAASSSCSLRSLEGFSDTWGRAVDATDARADVDAGDGGTEVLTACPDAPRSLFEFPGVKTPDPTTEKYLYGLYSVSGVPWVVGGQYRQVPVDASTYDGFAGVLEGDPPSALTVVARGLNQPRAVTAHPSQPDLVILAGGEPRLLLLQRGVDANAPLAEGRDYSDVSKRFLLHVGTVGRDVLTVHHTGPRVLVVDRELTSSPWTTLELTRTAQRFAVRGDAFYSGSDQLDGGGLEEIRFAPDGAPSRRTLDGPFPVTAIASEGGRLVYSTSASGGDTVYEVDEAGNRVPVHTTDDFVAGLAVDEDFVLVQTARTLTIVDHAGKIRCRRGFVDSTEPFFSDFRASSTAILTRDYALYVTPIRVYRLRLVR